MSKEETGDEWHAQNILSLTVFGCAAHASGWRNFVLLCEVLDHDSQMAFFWSAEDCERESKLPVVLREAAPPCVQLQPTRSKQTRLRVLLARLAEGMEAQRNSAFASFAVTFPRRSRRFRCLALCFCLAVCQVTLHLMGEQHGKGSVDQLFGRMSRWTAG